MKIRTGVLSLALVLSACSDKSATTTPEDQWTGSFVASETSEREKTTKTTYIKGELIQTTTVQPKVERSKYVVVTQDKYQEFILVKKEGDAPILKERIFVVSQNEEGHIELELVADECGAVTASEKITWTPNVNPESVQSYDGTVLVRENPQTVKKKIEEILAKKESGLYKKGCSQTLRNIEYFWDSIWDW
jgi:hypothetical protein